jgi:membrane protease YdiL (CAAX protease family)
MVLRPFSPAFVPTALAEPNKAVVAILFLVAGFGACVEELGWTAFATPRLLERHGVLASGLTLGALWGLWHVLINTSHATLYGGLFVQHLLVMGDGILPLLAYRVLMVWVYKHTESLPLGMLLHVCYTAILVTLGPSGVTPAQQVMNDALFLAALCVFVAAVELRERGHIAAANATAAPHRTGAMR